MDTLVLVVTELLLYSECSNLQMSLNRERLGTLYDYTFISSELASDKYLLAICTLASANQPEDIAKVYILALLSFYDNDTDNSYSLVERVYDLLDSRDRLENSFKTVLSEQMQFVAKAKETILKSSVIIGIPKAINALKIIRDNTPASLVVKIRNSDREDYFISQDTIRKHSHKNIEQGLNHWDMTYNKVSDRIISDLNSFYPDLWQFIVDDVYGDILSFDKIVDAKLTSLIVICDLIPLDVNPQLRGHLRGALNVGWDKETIEQVRTFALMICTWCDIRWKGEVFKL